MNEINVREQAWEQGYLAGVADARRDYLRLLAELSEAVLMDWPNKVDVARKVAGVVAFESRPRRSAPVTVEIDSKKQELRYSNDVPIY